MIIEKLNRKEIAVMVAEGYNPLNPDDVRNYLQGRPADKSESLMRIIAESSPYYGSVAFENGQVKRDDNKSNMKISQKFGADYDSMHENYSHTSDLRYIDNSLLRQNTKQSLAQKLKNQSSTSQQKPRQRDREDYNGYGDRPLYEKKIIQAPKKPNNNGGGLLGGLHSKLTESNNADLNKYYEHGKDLALAYAKAYLRVHKNKNDRQSLREANAFNQKIEKKTVELSGQKKLAFDKGVTEIVNKLKKRLNG